MKKVIFYFFTLLVTVWLGVLVYNDNGYVLISYHGWTIETSLFFTIATLFAIFLTCYLLLRINSKIKLILLHAKLWFLEKHKRLSRNRTVLGLYDFIEGNWASSEKKLISAAKYSDMPFINYVAAAVMAQYQHAFERRDNYLNMAQKSIKDRPNTVGLVQARLQIENKQWEEALATLQYLHRQIPKNTFVLQLLKQVYLELQDWDNLIKLLPLFRKRHAFDAKELDNLEIFAYKKWLLASTKDDSIRKKWNNIPSYLQKHPELLAIYVQFLLHSREYEKAEDILKIFLRKNLDKHLLELYTVLPSSNLVKKLARAENWLKNNVENPYLLFCLGRICKQQQLWGKARNYLEKSLKLTPMLATYLELGKIFEEQNDMRGAINAYNKGLWLAITKDNNNL